MHTNRIWRFSENLWILHILYWIYSFTAAIHERIEFHGGKFTEHVPVTSIIKFFQISSVYFTILFLLPKYLKLQRYFIFCLLLLLTVTLSGFATAFSIDIYYNIKNSIQTFSLLFMAIPLSIDILIITVIFVAVTILYNHYKSDRLAKKAEKARLESELSFLKAQINPHFLFNAINSIFVLIDIDKQLASDTLLKFSGMLRYQLYECTDQTIEIERELSFISDYIGIESLRKEDNLKVTYNISSGIKYFKIPPFILMPFVENAFKHVSKNNESNNYISIGAGYTENSFQFNVTNTYEINLNNKPGGIGLQNVKRRLDLLFPGKHELNILKKDNIYSTTLTLHV
jgi:two-component system, LytTR family, sensor kinase